MSTSSWLKLSEELKERDPRLRPIIDKIGSPTIQFEKNQFRALVEAILSQQLAPKASQTIIERFRKLERPFPKPASIIQWKEKKLRQAGVSPQKARYVLALSIAWQNRSWRSGWDTLADEAIIDRLTTVKGIGVWTAQMFLIFSMGRPDVLPCGDYGVRRGIRILFNLSDLPQPAAIPALVPHWKGASSVASWYLWRGLDEGVIA